MKRKSLIITLLILGSILFADGWDVQEYPYDLYVYYIVTKAPEKYENLIGSSVVAVTSHRHGDFGNAFNFSCKSGIIEFLENEDFVIDKMDGIDSPFLSKSFIEKYFPEVLCADIPVSKEDLSYIWENLSSKYVGFSDMKKRGLNKKKFNKIKNTSELKALFDKYMEDCHFDMKIREFIYYQETAYDEGCKKSKDQRDIYFEQETSNAYYVRFTSCVEANANYFTNLEAVGVIGRNKEFIILDARSNYGGSNYSQEKLQKILNLEKYKGTVIVLQDNWSTSAGEVWSIFGNEKSQFKTLLVGTHSGGMQNYNRSNTIKNDDLNIEISFGSQYFGKILPKNYLGEGRGYEPDIWATTETMASVLTGLGVDVTGITFQ